MVTTELDHLLKDATNDVIRVKLQNLHEVCYHLVVMGKQRLTVPDVIATYAARVYTPSQSIAESSIRNRREGANPYQKLYRAWESASNHIRNSNPRRFRRETADVIICQEDVAGITDHVLRHQVSLLLAQNRSYKSQLDTLRRGRDAPVVTLTGSTSPYGGRPVDSRLALTEAEVEAVKDFTAANKLRARCLRLTKSGGVETIDGRHLADPGFIEALQKIVESYRRPT